MPALTTLETLEILAPDVYADARASSFLTLAAQRMASSSVWGDVYVQAVCYLAAHMCTLSPATAAAASEAATVAGPITARSTGDWSVSYGSAGATATSMTDAALARTNYGCSWMELRDSRGVKLPQIIRARTA